MTHRFVSLLTRATRIRSQIEQEVRRAQPNVLRLVRMKRLLLLLKEQLHTLTALHLGPRLTPIPVLVSSFQRSTTRQWA
jgi:hypothetical protein